MNKPLESAIAFTELLPPLRVRRASDADGPAWMRFVEAHPGAMLGHHWGWRAVITDIHSLRTHYLIAERGNRIVGVLPMAEVKSLLFGHSLVSLPFTPCGGPIALDASSLAALTDEATALADRLNVGHLELRNAEPLGRDFAHQDLYVLFRRMLSPDHDANMLAIPRKQRAMVRKGINNNLTASIGDAAIMHALYADNVHRHGTPAQSRRFFEKVEEVFGNACNILVVNSPDGKPLSSVISIYWIKTAFPFYAGDVIEARNYSANDFKYWALMRQSVERDHLLFDYGRSKRGTGPYDFKRNWGFEPISLHYEFLLRKAESVPEMNPLNPRFKFMIEAWRRMPRWFVNAAGPRLVRTLG
jgi:FemAB-related protein (PEP-CTERM system-associated)